MLPQYLYKNHTNTSFYFGSYIPLDLQHLYQGRKMFRISLKCCNKVQSKRICLHLNKKIKTTYEQIRMGKPLSIYEIKRILNKEVEKSKKHSSWFSYVGVDRSKDRTKQKGIETLQKEEIDLKSRKKTDFDDEVEKLLGDEGITDINRKSGYFRIFRENYIKIESLKIKWKRELILGEIKSEYDYVSQILDGEAKDIISEVESYTEKKLTKEPKSKTIRKIVDEFLDLRKGVVGEKMLGEYRSLTNEFIEIIGNIPVSTLSKEHIRKYIKTQRILPINRRKNPKYRGLSIDEIMKLTDVKPQSRQNVNKYLTRLTVLLQMELENSIA